MQMLEHQRQRFWFAYKRLENCYKHAGNHGFDYQYLTRPDLVFV
jgi:hypothetical protein